jgi:hypothetical protein
LAATFVAAKNDISCSATIYVYMSCLKMNIRNFILFLLIIFLEFLDHISCWVMEYNPIKEAAWSAGAACMPSPVTLTKLICLFLYILSKRSCVF